MKRIVMASVTIGGSLPSTTGLNVSTKKFSSPAGVHVTNIFAFSFVVFRNECTMPREMNEAAADLLL